MMDFKNSILNISLILLFIVKLLYADINYIPVDEPCLQCLCELASGCDLTKGCNEKVCGPFQITIPFWIDAGKPVLHLDQSNNPGAFARCANDPVCSSKAVSIYMERYGLDCNNDRVVDCLDYALIHQFGFGPSCKTALFPKKLNQLKKCLKINDIL